MSTADAPPWAQALLAQVCAQSDRVASLAGQMQNLQAQFASLSLTAPTIPDELTPDSLRLLASDPRLPDHLQPFLRLLEAFGTFTLSDDQKAVAQAAYDALRTALSDPAPAEPAGPKASPRPPQARFIQRDG